MLTSSSELIEFQLQVRVVPLIQTGASVSLSGEVGGSSLGELSAFSFLSLSFTTRLPKFAPEQVVITENGTMVNAIFNSILRDVDSILLSFLDRCPGLPIGVKWKQMRQCCGTALRINDMS
jgi:hypothetical protein